MDCTIYPSTIRGSVLAPSSKSYAQRAIFAAALANGESVLEHFQYCDDNWAAVYNAVNLGAEIRHFGDRLYINGSNQPRTNRFYTGESGLSSRILSALLMTLEGDSILEGSGSLIERPFTPIFQVYEQLEVPYKAYKEKLPLTVGTIKEIKDLEIDGSLSSQFITGLLLALGRIGFSKQLRIKDPKSLAYIDMTIEILKHFDIHWDQIETNCYQLQKNTPYKPCRYRIEGDWSGASFLIVAGLTAGEISIKNLQYGSKQADNAILDLGENYFHFQDETVQIFKHNISPFDFDATHSPDLFPPLATLAASADGPCRIKGTSRLKHKESDRAKVLQTEFSKLWVRIDLEGDEMIVHPSKPTGGLVNAQNDHRIAMALSIMALNASEPVTIQGVECVSKSYPMFFEDLKSLGAQLEFDE